MQMLYTLGLLFTLALVQVPKEGDCAAQTKDLPVMHRSIQ